MAAHVNRTDLDALDLTKFGLLHKSLGHPSIDVVV